MLGTFQRLRAVRSTDHGVYFSNGEFEVLLPRREVPPQLAPGQELDLFLYRDSEDRPTATLVLPLAQLGQLAWMDVVDHSEFGAFVRWGLAKDLLVPLVLEQKPLVVGQRALVRVLLDAQTDRLVGSTKIAPSLLPAPKEWKPGRAVKAVWWKPHELGWNVVVDHLYGGLVYHNELPKSVGPGSHFDAWIQSRREDGKLDVVCRPLGFEQANQNARERVCNALREGQGLLPLGDQSTPEEIQALLGLSKKAFKTALGTLYKDGLVKLEPQKTVAISDLADAP